MPPRADLLSPRFRPNAALRAVRRGHRVLRAGDRGVAVRLVQEALLDLGYPLPAFGADGDFGAETVSAVRAFQRAQRLRVDGAVGRGTLGTLDAFDARQHTIGEALALLTVRPDAHPERAAWLLSAHAHGFVQFKFNARRDLTALAAGRSVGAADPTRRNGLGTLRVMCAVVRGPITRWIDAGAHGALPTVTLGSFITASSGAVRARRHGRGLAIDINDLRFTATARDVVALLEDLPRGNYGIGLPYQGPFFPGHRRLAVLKRTSRTGRIRRGLKKWRSHVWRSTRDSHLQEWVDEIEEAGRAYSLVGSRALRAFIERRTRAGSRFVIFPDNPNHLHIDVR